MHISSYTRTALAVLAFASTLGVIANTNAGSLSFAAPEGPFMAETRSAMDTMMAAMEIKPSGDADRDFSAMMIPHHQGAIDMAIAELRYGRNEQLRRIAQEIIVTQQQEIAAMQLAVGQSLPSSIAAPDQQTDRSALAPRSASSPR